MTRIYASPEDLPERWQGHEDAEALIRRASNLVTVAIASAVFPTDAYGMPTGDHLRACREAVVEQVSTWLSTGVNPLTGYAGKGKTVTSKGSNGSTIAYAQDMAAEAHLNALAEGVTLTAAARLPLDAEGLTQVVLIGGGPAGRLYARGYAPWRTEVGGGYVNLSRAEGVVRLDFNVRTTPVAVDGIPDHLWPEAGISQTIDGVLVSLVGGNLTISGPIAGDYAEGMLLWGASRG